MSSLFEDKNARPLADLIRPQHLSEVVGQAHLLGENGKITRMLVSGKVVSMILWGPPGCGKTTIAKILAKESGMYFELISALFTGVSDLRKIFDDAKKRKSMGVKTLLFIDEIHRFNRSQQDTFLPYVEDGTVVLIGATTENPSFELNSALLSRMQVVVVKALDDEALMELFHRAQKKLGKDIPIEEAALSDLINLADGDGRYLLNMLEILSDEKEKITLEVLGEILSKKMPLYDKDREGHYNLISALHKSLRGSDAQAALYWMERMLEGGEDPKYILRRLTRFATEDIGLADPGALQQALLAWEAYERLGSPEGDLAIAYLVVYLATAPKSNSIYMAHGTARGVARKTGSLNPPMHILNAPTKMMKELGYGDGYRYDHDQENAFSGQDYFPEKMSRQEFYHPNDRGFEREIKKRLEYWDNLRKQSSNKK